MIFTLVLLLSLFFFYQEHGPPMPVYAERPACGRPSGRPLAGRRSVLRAPHAEPVGEAEGGGAPTPEAEPTGEA